MSDNIVLEMEVPIGKHIYRVGRMSVFDQMNIAADFRDILIGLAMMKAERPKDMKDAEFIKTTQMITLSRGGISPEVRNRVVTTCFRHITRRQVAGWSPILASEGMMQFDDIGLPDVAKLLFAVFEHNKLLDFFSESPSSSDGQGTDGNGQA